MNFQELSNTMVFMSLNFGIIIAIVMVLLASILFVNDIKDRIKKYLNKGSNIKKVK